MIAVPEREEPGAVAPEDPGRARAFCLGIHHHVVDAVFERVLNRAPASVERLARDMVDDGFHAATATSASRSAMASTTSMALA
jgi:hypothetical protein